MQVDFMLNRR